MGSLSWNIESSNKITGSLSMKEGDRKVRGDMTMEARFAVMWTVSQVMWAALG